MQHHLSRDENTYSYGAHTLHEIWHKKLISIQHLLQNIYSISSHIILPLRNIKIIAIHSQMCVEICLFINMSEQSKKQLWMKYVSSCF